MTKSMNDMGRHMSHLAGSARAALVAFLLVSCGLAHAQFWDASKLLADTHSPNVNLVQDGKVVDKVERTSVEHTMRVVSRIAEAYSISPTPKVVIQSAKSPNAFATMRSGSPVVGINTAMLEMAGDNEDYLAVVMGHEFGHLQAKHTTEGVQRAQVVTILGAVLGAMVDINEARHGRNTGGAGTLLGGLGASLANAKFSRDQEREADRLGIDAMARAGYDPGAAPALWRLMETRGGGASGLWMSSHPSNAEREAALVGELNQPPSRGMPVREHNHRKPLMPLGFVGRRASWTGKSAIGGEIWSFGQDIAVGRGSEFGLSRRLAAQQSRISVGRLMRGCRGATSRSPQS